MGKKLRKYEKPREKKLHVGRIILVLVIFIVVIFVINKLIKRENPIPQNVVSIIEKINVGSLNDKIEVEYVPDQTITMSVIGDIMCHNTQYMDAATNGGYDFSYVFDDIKSKIEPADIAIGNLETTFAGKSIGYSSYPTFNTPEALATDLKELGIDVLSTVNNHCMDKGYNGLVKTIEELDKAGVLHTGTYSSPESANQIITYDAKGVKCAFLAYTYGTNGIPVPSGKEYCVNFINKDKIAEDIKKAKALNVDVIVVQMHWGIEYQASPNDEQKDLADFLFKNGVDIILGSHPHVLQKMEKVDVDLPDGTKKQGFVIYSLGNFVSGQYKAYTRQSVILNIALTKSGKNGKINIDSVDYTPIYTYKSPRYRILDINSVINNYNNGNRTYSESTISLLRTELQQVISRVGEPIK